MPPSNPLGLKSTRTKSWVPPPSLTPASRKITSVSKPSTATPKHTPLTNNPDSSTASRESAKMPYMNAASRDSSSLSPTSATTSKDSSTSSPNSSTTAPSSSTSAFQKSAMGTSVPKPSAKASRDTPPANPLRKKHPDSFVPPDGQPGVPMAKRVKISPSTNPLSTSTPASSATKSHAVGSMNTPVQSTNSQASSTLSRLLGMEPLISTSTNARPKVATAHMYDSPYSTDATPSIPSSSTTLGENSSLSLVQQNDAGLASGRVTRTIDDVEPDDAASTSPAHKKIRSNNSRNEYTLIGVDEQGRHIYAKLLRPAGLFLKTYGVDEDDAVDEVLLENVKIKSEILQKYIDDADHPSVTVEHYLRELAGLRIHRSKPPAGSAAFQPRRLIVGARKGDENALVYAGARTVANEGKAVHYTVCCIRMSNEESGQSEIYTANLLYDEIAFNRRYARQDEKTTRKAIRSKFSASEELPKSPVLTHPKVTLGSGVVEKPTTMKESQDEGLSEDSARFFQEIKERMAGRDTLEKENSKLRQDLEEAQAKCKSQHNTIVEQTNQLNSRSLRLSEKTNAFDEQATTIVEKDGIIKAKDDVIKTKDSDIDKKSSEIERQKDALATKDKQLEQHAETIRKQKLALQSTTNQLNKHVNTIKSKDAEIKHLQENITKSTPLSQQAKQISNIQPSISSRPIIDERSEEVNSLRALRNDLIEVKAKLEISQRNEKKLEQEADKSNEDFKELREQRDSLQQVIEKIKANTRSNDPLSYQGGGNYQGRANHQQFSRRHLSDAREKFPSSAGLYGPHHNSLKSPLYAQQHTDPPQAPNEIVIKSKTYQEAPQGSPTAGMLQETTSRRIYDDKTRKHYDCKNYLREYKFSPRLPETGRTAQVEGFPFKIHYLLSGMQKLVQEVPSEMLLEDPATGKKYFVIRVLTEFTPTVDGSI